MEKCYEYFNCKNIKCVMFAVQDDKPCWSVEETMGCFPGANLLEEIDIKDNCEFCLYKINNDKNDKH